MGWPGCKSSIGYGRVRTKVDQIANLEKQKIEVEGAVKGGG